MNLDSSGRQGDSGGYEKHQVDAKRLGRYLLPQGVFTAKACIAITLDDSVRTNTLIGGLSSKLTLRF